MSEYDPHTPGCVSFSSTQIRDFEPPKVPPLMMAKTMLKSDHLEQSSPVFLTRVHFLIFVQMDATQLIFTHLGV